MIAIITRTYMKQKNAMKYQNYRITSRVLVFILLAFVIAWCFAQYSSDAYQKGTELTIDKYMKDFDSVKEELLSWKPYANYLYSLVVTSLGMAIIIGLYEFAVTGVSLLLQRILRR